MKEERIDLFKDFIVKIDTRVDLVSDQCPSHIIYTQLWEGEVEDTLNGFAFPFQLPFGIVVQIYHVQLGSRLVNQDSTSLLMTAEWVSNKHS
jgi:hypothetical protein